MNWNLIEKNLELNNNYKKILNINELKLGMHIKYIKDDKIYNGGFLVKIENNNNPHLIYLILKTNIIWKLKFLKYEILAKDLSKKINLKKLFSKEIEKKIKEREEKINI